MAHLERKFFSQEIRVSSHDAHTGGSSINPTGHFTANFQGLTQHLDHVHGVQVVSAIIPNTFYNIPLGRNTFTFDELGTEYTVSVVPGNYTYQELLDTLGAAITASGAAAVYSLGTIDSITGLASMTFTTNPANLTITSGFYTNPLAYYLGFDLMEGTVATSTAATLAIPYLPRLQGVTEVYIHCHELASPTDELDNDQDSHYLACIGLGAIPFGGTCHYQIGDPHTNLKEYPSERSITSLTVSLRDGRGVLLDLNQAEWSFMFKIYYSL